ncbi:DUF2798 domain-containing protein [Neptunomonas antarctica]|uniref:DUF2798 domain-containing protein n=1 Tax=Neptunomonas antarctica TaxID=619304 RepID=A0A1N7KH44_9GAMM|nr:DUF2798 domain-containing protein [Neptunomonas antarctica]SIS60800.1 Protein of unknown function [Neptunomonas antarctica]
MKQRIIFALLMSFLLSILMTCWVTWINLGWTPGFYTQWLHAFTLAWPVAGLIAFFVGPEIYKLSAKLAR